MAFLMMLSVIVLSMLMILLFPSRLISCLLCGNNWIWLLNLNLTYEAVWIRGMKWLVVFNAGKTQIFFFRWCSTRYGVTRKLSREVV